MDFSNTDRKNNRNYLKISPSAIVSLALLLCVVAFFLATKDPGGRVALRWLISILGIAVIIRPLLPFEAMKFWDSGFGVSFGLGLALMFMPAWFIAATGLIGFGNGIIFVVVICAIIISVIYLTVLCKKNEILFRWSGDEIEKFLLGFTVFAIVFCFAFWVIGFNPTLDSGTENYMDYGFVKAIYRQQKVAPWDIWCSGLKLNYYYLGQAATAFMCRLAFTTPEYGYNLMLATFWGMVFVMSGEIANAVMKVIAKVNDFSKRKSKVSARIAGIIAGFMTAFAGNGHWLFFGIFKPILCKLAGKTDTLTPYWFPEATVYISAYLGDPDNGKNEFPSYSAILGDLHAHVLNVIFVLPLIALLFDYAFSKENRRSYVRLILVSILLGMYKGSNFWDFAIYFVITGAVVVFCDIREKGFNKSAILGILIKALMVIGISILVIAPFTLSFEKMASSIMIAHNHTPIVKMLVLWSVPFVTVISFLVYLFIGSGKKIKFVYGSKMGLLAIMLCTMGLVITPEVVYIMDIYGEENARFNTMFKLTYQAFILFGILTGIIAGIYYARLKAGFIAILVLTILLSGYTVHSVNDWMGNVSRGSLRKGISTISELYNNEYAIEAEVMDILEADERKVLNIVEAAGDSYTHNDALSVMTGTCTPLGWYVHEWMWRNDPYLASARSDDVRCFYENGNENFCREFLEKYEINYIFAGPAEYQRYVVNDACFEYLGQTVWEKRVGDNVYRLIRVK